MAKKNILKNFKKILEQVPPDYYHSGVKSNPFQKYWHQKKWGKLEKYLESSQKNRLLDIGCADGTTTKQIYQRFPNLKITGIDLYEKAIKFAKRSNPKINFFVADAHKLPFKKHSFDIIVAIETLEHLHDSALALSEIKRVLKPKGSFVVVQDTDSLLFKLVWWLWTRWKGSVWKGSHINCVGPKILISKLKRNGFIVEKHDIYNLGMEIIAKVKNK